MKLFSLLLLLIQSPLALAELNVADSPLIIAGKGLIAKDSGSWVALKCMSYQKQVSDMADCEAFRHVYYNAELDQLSMIGPIIQNGPELKQQLREVARNAKKYARARNQSGPPQGVFVVGAAFGGMIAAQYLSCGEQPVLSNQTASRIMEVLLIGIVIEVIRTNDGKSIQISEGGRLSRPLQDQNGWNWQVRPKRVSNKMMKAYISYLQHLR